MIKLNNLKSSLIFGLVATVGVCKAGIYAENPTLGVQTGVRYVLDGLDDKDRYSGVYRLSVGGKFRTQTVNAAYVKFGYELGVNSSFDGRAKIVPVSGGTTFMPLQLTNTESFDGLLNLTTNLGGVDINVFAGGNVGVLKPMNTVISVESKFRPSAKVAVSLEKKVFKSLSANLSYHHTFNNHGDAVHVTAVRPFKLKGYYPTGMLLAGVSYQTQLLA